MNVSRAERLRAAYAEVLAAVGQEGQPGTADTPRRAANAMLEMTSGYDVDVEALFTTFDKDGYDEMVVVDGIAFSSLCEHHLLPFTGRVGVVYVPDERVVGLSKIPRLVEAYARRLQIQERMTDEIAAALEAHLSPLGVLVVVEAEHMCATLRGVRKPGMMMRTSALRGVMLDKPEARAEAFALLAR